MICWSILVRTVFGMFIEYDLSVYPVTVVLEENISRQLKDKASLGYIVICKNREEFESIVVGAIKTKRVLEMMRQLLNAAENKSLNGNAENETDEDDNDDEIHVNIKK